MLGGFKPSETLQACSYAMVILSFAQAELASQPQ